MILKQYEMPENRLGRVEWFAGWEILVVAPENVANFTIENVRIDIVEDGKRITLEADLD